MSYAVKTNGQWRAVNSLEDCVAGEFFSTTQPPMPVVAVEVQSVSMRQARLELHELGLLDGVDAAIAAIPDAHDRKAAQIEWEFSNDVRKDSPLIQLLAPGLGLDASELTALFNAAALR